MSTNKNTKKVSKSNKDGEIIHSTSFRWVFIGIFIPSLLVAILMVSGVISLYLGWYEYKSTDGWEYTVHSPIAHNISTAITFIVLGASLFLIPVLSKILRSEKPPIKKLFILLVAIIIVGAVFMGIDDSYRQAAGMN